MAEHARALWFTAPGMIEIRRELITPGAGQVLVKSRLMGISHGTEMLFFRGTFPEHLRTDENLSSLSGYLGYPMKYGYINVGMTSDERRVFAFYPHQDIFAVTPGELVELPDELTFEDAVFLAHMETALSIVQDLNPVLGETVLVLGQGTVGLLTAGILSYAGGVEVYTADPVLLRRRVSMELGCRALDPAHTDLKQQLLDATNGRGVDAAVNVSGSWQALQLAIDTLCFEGTVIEASWYGSKPVHLNLGSAFHRKRLQMRGSQVSNIGIRLTGRWDKNRRMGLANKWLGILRPSKYITNIYSLDEAAEAYRLLDEHPERTLQVVLKP
jgi:threonine dehydrogenase-like Zn-dependent dehydrogenase